ncbi:MAG TPA: T9SS type A sorting domain-containing protein [Bacteroidetes bacterium]|nr:T9SS type A sorting domain-containing protein [Bacteroidota bacterium]HIL56902.1 T9SS type A sorting domain-containing protein [Rhodothermales bacterium]
MRALLLACALLAPTIASAQWTFSEDVAVPYTTAPGSGIHGVAVDSEGRLWLQNYYGSEPLARNGETLTTRALYVLNEDGTQAACSPIKYLEDNTGAVVDTLGYYTTSAGTLDSRTGRGMTSDSDGNIVVSQYDMLYLLDATSCTSSRDSSIVQLASAQPLPGTSLTEAATDGNGNVYVTAVVGAAQPIFSYGPGLTPGQNVSPNAYDISRDLLASNDGTLIIDHAFTKPGAVVHYRSNSFVPFDSLGISLRGLVVESSGVQPGTNYLWVSSGPGGAFNPNEDPEVETNYQAFSWYAFDQEDLLERDGGGAVIGTVENPTPVDSIIVTAEEWGDTAPGPRGIAFSADGNTAWVINFGAPTGSDIKKYTKNDVAVENGAEVEGLTLGQNQPNPFSGRTEITFSLEAPGHTALRVYDVTGREVMTLVDRTLVAGEHAATFDADGLAPGTYVYTLEFEGRVASRRMTVVR